MCADLITNQLDLFHLIYQKYDLQRIPEYSDSEYLLIGVQKALVLGPFLFNIYMCGLFPFITEQI